MLFCSFKIANFLKKELNFTKISESLFLNLKLPKKGKLPKVKKHYSTSKLVLSRLHILKLFKYRIVLRTRPSYIKFGIKIFCLILKVVKFL